MVSTAKEDSALPCLCFVHVPKAGGTTLINALSGLFEPHEITGHMICLPETTDGLRMIAGHYNFHQFEDVRGKKFYVTCLRKPLSRLVSTFRFWKSIRPESQSGAAPHIANLGQLSFADFVKSDDPVFRTSLDNPIVRQFCHDLGSEPVADQDFAEACANLKKMDFIFFNESLDDDIRVFFREIDVALDEIGRSNDTEKKHIEDPDNYRAAEPVAMPTNDPAFSQALDKYTLYDRQLYDFALELMRKRIRDGLSLPELPTKRFKVTEGEKVPAASPAMKKILGRGWQWDGEIIWSVADEAHLRFTVRWKSKCENSFARVELIPGMFTGRGRLDVTVSAQGGGQRQIIFIEPGYVLMRKKIGDDADFVCAGNGPFFLDVPLPPSPDSSGGYLLKFAIGPRSSPLTLNYNNDGRPLGIRIESVRILTAAEAAIPLR